MTRSGQKPTVRKSLTVATRSNGSTTSETISGTNTTSYTWDYENRLTSVTLPSGGGTVSFK